MKWAKNDLLVYCKPQSTLKNIVLYNLCGWICAVNVIIIYGVFSIVVIYPKIIMNPFIQNRGQWAYANHECVDHDVHY
ncbi:hypothetical protein ACJX0J_036011, partial [Zea mays]